MPRHQTRQSCRQKDYRYYKYGVMHANELPGAVFMKIVELAWLIWGVGTTITLVEEILDNR